MFEYEVIRSNRKTVSIQVLENGDVVLRVPLRYPDSKIQEIVKRNTGWIKKTRIKQAENMSKKLVLNDDEIKKLKKYAESYIRSRVDYFAKIMGVKPSGVKITSAQKRFGSCNGKNSLCFSYILMLYPNDAIDYVVVHELAHIKHHNHSKSFYKCVAEVLPDYSQRERLLTVPQVLPDFS